MRGMAGFAAGLLFGAGLILSGMSNPAKVLNFLDIFGQWDPSLAFVMGGASVTAWLGYRMVWRRGAPIAAPDFATPPRWRIDTPLLAGSAVFGIGWGIGGFCPGPALTALVMGSGGVLVFLPAMLAGLWLGRTAKQTWQTAPSGDDA